MTRRDEAVRRESFNRLVAEGVYSDDFDHSEALKSFVRRVVKEYGPEKAAGRPVRVLDCGCGTGVWLDFLAGELQGEGFLVSCYGFDLSDAMVELARWRLESRKWTGHVKRGDVLNQDSYRFEGTSDGFDLVFAFDLVQQLPRRHQYAACARLISRLAPGGVALVFDHDRNSSYGRRMGRLKFLTRYLYLPLLPRYYCDARYPPLSKFAARLAGIASRQATLVVDQQTPKLALVVRAREDD